MNVASLLSPALTRFRRTRYKALLGMTLLCLVLRENYPFSHFPMYASFSNRTYYIYLADAKGAAIKTRQFGVSTSELRKLFDQYNRTARKHYADAGGDRDLLAEGAAGQSLLNYLEGISVTRRETKKLLAGVQIQRGDVHQDGHALLLETRVVARH